jgi:hypothetical protein
LAIHLSPHAGIAERVGGIVEFLFRHVHKGQSARQVSRLDMVVLPHHLDALLARHVAVANVLTGMVASPAVTELDILG